jgi:hypothetical protein
MITAEDVMKLGETFWELTRTHAPIESIRPLFINPGVLIPDGELMTLEAHHAMHGGFKDQFHDWQEMTVTPISEDPERVRAVGLVAWEASFTDGRPGRIRSVVGETWIIERCADGALRWVHYWSNSIDLAEGSASFDP